MGKAIEFYNASELLWQKVNSSDNSRLSSPFIMCAAFSIELYLKSLDAATLYNIDEVEISEENVPTFRTLYSKSNLHGHKLIELFKKLPLNTQTKLRSAYDESPPASNYTSLDEALDAANSNFVDSRYSFEGNSVAIEMTLLNKLSVFFHEYVYGLYKEQS